MTDLGSRPAPSFQPTPLTTTTGTPAVSASPAPAPARGSTRRFASGAAVRTALERAVPPAIVVAILLGVWTWYVEAFDVRPQVLPSPWRVLGEGWRFRDIIWQNTVPTLQATVYGFAVSLVVGFVFAVLLDFSGLLRRGLYPILVASQTIPVIAIAPLMIIWFGFELKPKIILVALLTFFPMTVSWVEGFNSTEREATNLMRSMGAGRIKVFRFVRFPSALPYFFAGLRIAITYAVVAAVFAEYVGATKGLGIFMQLQKNSFRTDLVLAAVLVTSLLTIALFLVTYALQRITIPWYSASRKHATTA